jgi:hypothetical protein
MNLREYRDKCYKIARATGVYLKVKQHLTGKPKCGKLYRWYEINDKECLLDMSIDKGFEMYDLKDVICWVKNGNEYPMPVFTPKSKDLFSDI